MKELHAFIIKPAVTQSLTINRLRHLTQAIYGKVLGDSGLCDLAADKKRDDLATISFRL